MSHEILSPSPLAAEVAPSPVRTGALFRISVLVLFLELLLIRWLGTEIRIFSYLQNGVLLACFLALGLGCLTSRHTANLRSTLSPLFLLVLLLALPVTREAINAFSLYLQLFGAPGTMFQGFATSPLSTTAGAILGIILMFLLLMLLWDIFVPLGRLMGRWIEDHPRTIWAYSVNVAGSLVGIWLFVLLSILHCPPWIWFLVAAGITLTLIQEDGGGRVLTGALLGGIVGLSWLAGRDSEALEVRWSPYQKLALRRPVVGSPGYDGIGEYIVQVNNNAYQGMLDLSQARVRAHPERFPVELEGFSQYDLPPLLHPGPRKVLIVGAGTGNDTAGVLRHGTPEVTAVDIDPVILNMGQRLHPEKPYDSPHVHLVNDDARSFFLTNTDRYDLIVFGLLDAHTGNAMATTRLDHYVYTRESIQRARSLLAPGGVLVLTFEILHPFIPERMFNTLRDVFGTDPIYFRVPRSQYGWGGVMFVESEDQIALRARIADNKELSRQVRRWQESYTIPWAGGVPVATDDWPYIYLEHPYIPMVFFIFTGLLVLLYWRGIRRLRTPGLLSHWDRSHWHFFFLGAAFMLLEVHNLNKASVVLGNTWWINAVIISGILVLILLANLLVAAFPRLPQGPVYGLLCGSCVLLYFLDISQLASLPYALKALVVGLLTSLPMMFSGMVFIRSFASVAGKDVALGVNLLGALLGGLLQSLTFLTGIKALLLIVTGLYLAALLTRPIGRPRPVAILEGA